MIPPLTPGRQEVIQKSNSSRVSADGGAQVTATARTGVKEGRPLRPASSRPRLPAARLPPPGNTGRATRCRQCGGQGIRGGAVTTLPPAPFLCNNKKAGLYSPLVHKSFNTNMSLCARAVLPTRPAKPWLSPSQRSLEPKRRCSTALRPASPTEIYTIRESLLFNSLALRLQIES
ncbi:hypothetical protein E2C01_081615 [Portunus trituberculatus]|uniref:Uncharacterized protein n=1 Tax=Portunus trituberculatus TaxID=210409 RepID=A0A5B7IQ87_PORTR|nr:hypothetical protein [Portunus trituberculatus]